MHQKSWSTSALPFTVINFSYIKLPWNDAAGSFITTGDCCGFMSGELKCSDKANCWYLCVSWKAHCLQWLLPRSGAHHFPQMVHHLARSSAEVDSGLRDVFKIGTWALTHLEDRFSLPSWTGIKYFFSNKTKCRSIRAPCYVVLSKFILSINGELIQDPSQNPGKKGIGHGLFILFFVHFGRWRTDCYINGLPAMIVTRVECGIFLWKCGK